MIARKAFVAWASPLDRISASMSTGERPLDFVVILHLSDAPSLDAIRAGAKSAYLHFPTSSSLLNGGAWRFRPDLAERAFRTGGLASQHQTVESFVDQPLNPRSEIPLQQLVISPLAGNRMTLVTRFHHALCDGASALSWLAHQLNVAWRVLPPTTSARVHRPIALRRHPMPVRRSRYAYEAPSAQLHSAGGEPSSSRRWITFSLDGSRLEKAAKQRGEFSYGDVLATCFLEAMVSWNRHFGAGSEVGLWYPVNIREHQGTGFGNGTSRIRLYPRYPTNTPFSDKCRAVREQVDWCLTRGEWAIPRSHSLRFLMRAFRSSALERFSDHLLRCFLSRPGLDMGSAVFTHLRQPWSKGCPWVASIERCESVGMLHEHYPLGLSGASLRDKGWFTLTYDPARLSEDEVNSFIGGVKDQVLAAERGLV